MIEITQNSPEDKDKFKFIIPAELSKGKDGEWTVKGLASTESLDQQKEIIIQKGMDLSPIDQKKGFLNWDHNNSPECIIGTLDGYTRTPNGLFVQGKLFKNHTKAKAVYEIMSSLSEGDRGRMGMSVEGKILERDPFNPSIIRKCQIKNVALTMSPVNTSTYADIVKSMNAAQEVEFDSCEQESSVQSNAELPVFTASQVLSIVQKALSVGAGSAGAPAAKTGGDALQPSDMRAEKLKKKKMKKMDKIMYKSNLVSILDKLQVLYPHCSRSEIWEAVKDRLDTKFEIEKGGPGSGVKGHKTAQHINGWRTDTAGVKYKTIKDSGKGRFPEHELFVHKQGDKYKWAVRNNSQTVGEGHADSEEEAMRSAHTHQIIKKSEPADQPDLDKGIRIHSTSGKEREHKLYEDARQREDYERNKDKSRAELHKLAEESGASKHDKAKIRAQRDAAIQVGERDHVRPNVKG